MQQTSNLYKSILENDNHWFETRLIIDGVGTFEESQLRYIKTNLEMLQDKPKVGQAVAGEIEVRMAAIDGIPNMATLRPQTRVCNVTQQSEWLPQGIFFIDTRETTKNGNGNNVLHIHGYDAMLRSEQYFQSSRITGDSLDTVMVAEIARIMGVTVDSRTYTLMTDSYVIPLPTGYTLREILGYIAAMYAGCFLMTEEGKLRLVSILELPPETNYLIREQGDAITFGGDRILV